MNEDVHFKIGREIVPIHALLSGAEGMKSYTYSIGEAVHELATSAIKRLEEAEEELKDEHELFIAQAVLSAISTFALIGLSAFALQPNGSDAGDVGENPYTPEQGAAFAHALVLCDLAGQRWPAKAEWFAPVAELVAARKDGV